MVSTWKPSNKAVLDQPIRFHSYKFLPTFHKLSRNYNTSQVFYNKLANKINKSICLWRNSLRDLAVTEDTSDRLGIPIYQIYQIFSSTKESTSNLLENCRICYDESENTEFSVGYAALKKALTSIELSHIHDYAAGKTSSGKLSEFGIDIEPIQCSPPRRRPAYVVFHDECEYVFEI